MEFSEKLSQLRKSNNMTQEELAAMLFVSRAAVSKWEQGRGLPNIDSLKATAVLFGVTVDELLSGEELLSAAQNETREKTQRLQSSLFGLLDVMHLLFFALPLFGDGAGGAISVLTLTSWTRTVYLILFVLTALLGVVEILLQGREGNLYRVLSWLSVGLSLLITSFAALNRQPYVALFTLWILAVKGFLLFRRR